MSLNNFYFVTKDSFSHDYSIPYLWCSLKTYYEENSNKQWNWFNPQGDDDIFEMFKTNPPHILGLSVYVWNEEYLDNLAQLVKKEYPRCIIVIGGPQQNVKHNDDYFRDKPWVDIVLPGDAYGEIVLKEILDCYPINNYNDIPYIYYTNKNKDKLRSDKTINKREFKWPSNIFKRQEKYILSRIKDKQSQYIPVTAYYETSRGCPYKCIYCEWGGGIYTKVVKKPLELVCEDLEWLASVANVSNIEITDANFGIMKVDIKIAEKIKEVKEKYGYPKFIDFDAAKNNVDTVTKIKEILFEAGVIDFHKIAFQTLNEETKKNIERIDVPFEEQLTSADKLNKKFGKIPIYLEQILGLPGETYNTVCKQIDKINEHNLDYGVTLPVAWTLLPEAPAYAPEMRDKFKIVTVRKLVEINPKMKPGRAFEYHGSSINLVDSWSNRSVETVVGTYSYTPDDWIRMRRLNSFVVGGQACGINSFLIPYLNIAPSELYNTIIDFRFKDATLNRIFELDRVHANNWIYNPDVIDIGVDVNHDWPFIIPQHTLFSYAVLSNITAFYTELCEHLAVKYNDLKIIDLGYYISNCIIDLTYNYNVGRTFTTKYNWLEYFNGEQLVEGHCTYSINDTTIYFISEEVTPLWTSSNDEIAYYYQVAAKTNNVKVSKTIKRI